MTERRANVEMVLNRARNLKVWSANEATTRIEVVDRILGALGWDTSATDFECPSGSGDFLDYLLRWCGEPWMVVEAKRVGLTFHIDPTSVRSERSHVRSIKGLLSKGGGTLREAMGQAARYANDRGTPFCLVTNGLQWVFFRGLSTSRRPWTEGRALVFLSADDVLTRFDDFVDCLDHDGRRNQLALHLEQPTTADLPEPVVPAELLRFKRMRRDEEQAARIGVISSYLLAEIHVADRLEMLERCYVSPGQISEFDTSIRRLLKDSAERVDGGDAEVLEGDADSFARTVALRERAGLQHPVVVVGHIGAGKTTFVHSAFRKMKLDSNAHAFPAIIDLEGFGRAGTFHAEDEHRKVSLQVLEGLRRSGISVLRKRADLSEGVKGQADPFAMGTLRTLCHKPIDDSREVARAYWDRHEDEFGLKILTIVEEYKKDPVAWLIHFIRHLRHRFTREDGLRYPVLLAFDNIDQAHSDYQKCIYGLSQQIARETPAIVVFCIREDTYREGRHPRGFLSSTPLSFVFHVKAPALDHVLRRRLAFARTQVLDRTVPIPLGDVADDLPEWCERLERCLLSERSAGAELVGSLAGQNTRAALDMAGRVVVSGVRPDDVGGPTAAVLHGLVSVSTPRTMTERLGLANIFDAEPGIPVAHALRARLLAYLHGTSKLSHTRPLEEQTEVITSRFSAWGYQGSLVRSALERLVAAGLVCDAQNRGVSALDGLPKRVGLTASGLVHLTRLSRERHYRMLMACSGRWYDRELAERFVERCQASGSEDGCTFGDLLASTADDFFETYLQGVFTKENAALAALEEQRWVRDVLSLSNGVFGEKVDRPSRAWRDTAVSPSVAPDQGTLPFNVSGGLPAPSPVILGRIPRNLAARGTVWVPRILWALEWARQNASGPASPGDICRILREHGDIDVDSPNISRAFRDARGKRDGLWTVDRRRYSITAAGSALILSLLEADVR